MKHFVALFFSVTLFSLPLGATPFYSIQNLGTLGGGQSSGSGINQAGQVTGTSLNSAGQNRAFVWDGTTMHDLGPFGGGETFGVAINNSGQVAGSFSSSDRLAFRTNSSGGLDFLAARV